MKQALALAFFGLNAFGCSIDFHGPNGAEQVNACSSDADCGDGAVCWSGNADVGNSCIATSASLQGLMLVVSPSPGSNTVTSSPFILDASRVLMQTQGGADGYVKQFLATLPQLVQASVQVSYPPCGSRLLPAAVVFKSVAPQIGLPTATYTGASDTTDTPVTSLGPMLLPGVYDIYIQPQQDDSTCLFPPPVLIPQTSIGMANTHVAVNLVEPETLTGRIFAPPHISLSGFTLQLVDETDGRPLSDQAVLEQHGISLYADFAVRFTWPVKASPPLILVKPPAGLPLPTVYEDLTAALGVSSKLHVELPLTDIKARPRDVEARIVDEHGNKVIATVSLECDSIETTGSSPSAHNAFYSTTVQTDALGYLRTALPPGIYTVHAVPMDSETPSVANAVDFTVPDDPSDHPTCFCGHVITVTNQPILSGTVTTFGGATLSGVPILVQAALPPATGFLQLLGNANSFPRQSASSTDSSGDFSIGVDPGEINLMVQPAGDSGFSWFVRQLYLPPSGLGFDPVLPPPAILQGDIADPTGTAVGQALVTAWLPSTSAKTSTTALQIGQTMTDAGGHYVLYLPSSVAP